MQPAAVQREGAASRARWLKLGAGLLAVLVLIAAYWVLR
jgi:hypothetical protein